MYLYCSTALCSIFKPFNHQDFYLVLICFLVNFSINLYFLKLVSYCEPKEILQQEGFGFSHVIAESGCLLGCSNACPDERDGGFLVIT